MRLYTHTHTHTHTINLKNREGITLIALVITIIVLLVLAGATLAMISGDNGILKKVVQAKQSTQKASVEEKVKLAIQSALSSDYNEQGKITEATLIQELEKVELIENKDALEEIENSRWILAKDDKRYLIYSNGDLEIKQKNKLPEGYKELEYIESTGTQYIDTGLKTSFNNKVEVSYYASSSTVTWLFGARIRIDSEPWSKNGITISPTNSNIRYDFGNITNNARASTDNNGIAIIDNTGGYYNGAKQIDFSSATFADNTQTGNMLLGAIQDTGSTPGVRTPFIGKIYYCKIYDNNILIRNFIPTKNSSNIIGLYDTMTNTFYANAGTGNFIPGPEIK